MRALEIPWPVEELARRYRGARAAYAAKRYQALWLRARGLSAKDAAAAVGVTPEALRQWIKRAGAEGLDALAMRKAGSGATPKLTAAQRARVLAWADATPRITIRAARRRIAREWGISPSATQVWALVRGGGFRRVVPRKRHHRADAARLAAAQKT